MIIYGYKIEGLKKLGEAFSEELDLLYGKGNVHFVTCYSVSGFDPDLGVLGIQLSRCNPLFNPTPVSEITQEVSKDNIAEVDKVVSSLSEEIQAVLKDLTPDVYIFVEDDD